MFQPGDKVRLKTGRGPIMVVAKVEEDRYRCRWWDEKEEKFEQLLFRAEEIQQYKENE